MPTERRRIRRLFALGFTPSCGRAKCPWGQTPWTLQKDKDYTLALWQISDDMYFGIHAEQRVQKGPRSYFFRKVDDLMTPLTMDIFREMPSRAIGNAVLGADAGDADAINNFAVLFYAGIANSGKYEESAVWKLLKAAALKGNATAMYNVGVLFENRGEMEKAKIAYDTARVQEKESAGEKRGEEERGKMGTGTE